MKSNSPTERQAAYRQTAHNGGLPVSRKRKRKLQRRKKAVIAAAAALAVLLFIIAGISAYLRFLTDRINFVRPGDETIPEQFNPPTESLFNPVPSERGITNILLLGIDSRDSSSIRERSDAMLILTIDQNSGQLKLTSLQRDMLVHIPGAKEPAKINSANVLGGPMLAVRVVNETFRLDIKNYMVVNMRGMEQIIDLAGGVWIDVASAEITYLNNNIQNENQIFADSPQSALVSSAGLQLLDGRQAVGFSRIRKLDSDYRRMERQRTILQALFDAFLQADLLAKNNIIAEGLELITTNMTADEILNIGLNIAPRFNSRIAQLQIPIDGFFTEYSGMSWVNLCDFNGMIPLLQEFIYDKTFPFDPVRIIPGAPNSGTVMISPTPRPSATTQPTGTRPAETTTSTTTVSETTAETSAAETSVTPTAAETSAAATQPTATATEKPTETTAAVTVPSAVP